MACVVSAGGVCLWYITGGELPIWQCLYFALITVSTVGFGEPKQLENYAGAHVVVAAMIVSGIAAIAFFESTMTAMLVEGVIGKALRRKRMLKRLAGLNQHIIIAGCGRTGKFCVQELAALGRPFAIVDRDAAMLEELNEQYGGRLVTVAGDATDDHALLAAGVDRAWGLVSSLTDDKDNVFVVLSARTLNPSLHIVSKVLDTENEPKLIKAGANKLVSPHRIGGFRLVSELVRPNTMEFLDGMQSSSTMNFHIEDVEIFSGSTLAGLSLQDSPIRQSTNALVVAVREADGRFILSPGARHVLRAGSHLIIVGEVDDVARVRGLAGAGADKARN
jgi:voltage-gated potassium channel